MSQRTTGWRRALGVPAVYRWLQRSIGSPDARRIFVDDYLRPHPGDRILDIGCGTGELAGQLDGVDYHGHDPSAEYIAAARDRFGERGEFTVGGVGEMPFEPGSFDICVAKGVLHHLGDDLARELFAEARLALRPGGRLVTMDPVIEPGQSPIARFLAQRDRGEAVRSLDGYRSLAHESFDQVDARVRHDLLRVPYSHALLVATADPAA